MSRIESWESKGNVHLDLEASKPRIRHRVLSDIAMRYGGDGDYLDIGCGIGHISAYIRQRRPDAKIAIADAYQSCLDQTIARVGDVSRTYLLDEATFAPDEVIDRTFDVIILSHVLEHLRDPIAGLASLMRLLKPNGVLVVAVPNPARPDVLVRNVFRRHYVNRGHVFAWDPSHWRNFLERICGYEVAEYAGDFVPLLPGAAGRFITRITGRPLAKALPWWAISNIAVVRRPADVPNAADAPRPALPSAA